MINRGFKLKLLNFAPLAFAIYVEYSYVEMIDLYIQVILCFFF